MTTFTTEHVPCGDAGTMNLSVWTPQVHPVGSVLLIQEIFGVGAYIHAGAQRLAGAGFLVGAPDGVWRCAPGWAAGHDEAGLAASMEQVGKLDAEVAVGDCVAALGHLGSLAAAKGLTKQPAVLGFCLGGTLAWGVAAHAEPSCCVSYYGSGVPGMLGLIERVNCPTLFHFGNEDPYIPNEGVEAIAAAIAGQDGFVLNVEQAGHAFDNHESQIFWHEDAAKAAWTKTMSFLHAHAEG